MADPYLRLDALEVTFTGGRKPVRAVNGVDLTLDRGETLALIGESGSGKSVTLRAIMRLNPEKKTRIGGKITVGGRDVTSLGARALRQYRGGEVAMIFQEPLLALDPVYTLGDQITEAIRRHETIAKEDARKRALGLFERVRIPSPERRLDAYPHEMSGGMRQRAMIALALACRPELLLADEPTTALDATVQIQILLLLRELQRELGLSIIFVTHDLGAAVEVADRLEVDPHQIVGGLDVLQRLADEVPDLAPLGRGHAIHEGEPEDVAGDAGAGAEDDVGVGPGAGDPRSLEGDRHHPLPFPPGVSAAESPASRPSDSIRRSRSRSSAARSNSSAATASSRSLTRRPIISCRSIDMP